MYAWPILFPDLSNREDLQSIVGLFDDDTGEAIDLSGRTLATPGDFTGANWTVTDGNIVTASVTPLTIKDYPFGNEMQAMALVAGQNLGILAGDPITISDVNPLNSMTGYVTSYAPATGALIVQIGCAFLFEIRSRSHHDDGGYGASEFIGSDGCSAPIISAQLGSGLSVIDVGKVQIGIAASIISKLRHRTYLVGMTLYSGTVTRQLFIGKLPVLDGGVSTMPLALVSTANPYGLP